MRLPARIPTTRLVLLVTFLALALGATTTLEADSESEGLFSESSIPGTLEITDTETVKRYRYVDVDFDALIGMDGAPKDIEPGHTLRLNLFDDVVRTAILERVEFNPGSDYTWLGRLQGDPWGQVILVVGDGALVGNITTQSGFFKVRYAGNGVHAVSEIDRSAFPPELPPIAAPLGGRAASPSVLAAGDDRATIDLLVVYTPRARMRAGGDRRMRELITLAVAETNQAYENSQIDQRVNLVHSDEVDYEEAGFPLALSNLTHTSDGVMDEVHDLREAYAADEVVLLIEDFAACGLAWQMQEVSPDFESYAFAVVNEDCATGNYSFGHELGHTMGAQHDWYQYLASAALTPAFPYSFGYVNASAGWRTVMAYDDECEDRGLDCPRLPYWSNPDATLDDEPMGVPEGTSTSCVAGEYDPRCDADNRKTLNATASIVASFRGSTQYPNAPTDLGATAVLPTRIDLTWKDNCSQEGGFAIERSLDGLSGWAQIATVATNVTFYSDLSVQPTSDYYYRVQAFNDMGGSDYSNVASARTPAVVAGPLVYDEQFIDDDHAGISDGDRSGVVDCGETIELEVSLANDGYSEVTGIVGELSVADPAVIWMGNMASSYPSIEGLSSELNADAFEFEVAEDVPNGHLIHFDLAIEADNWGPGFIGLDVQVYCLASLQYELYLPLIMR